jgi:steroid delta-isomerase-like uncharacterized protein
MATIDNRVVAQKIYDDFNKSNLDALSNACVEDARVTDMVSGQTFEGPMGFRQASERWLTAFPDGNIEIVNQMVDGDTVVTEFVGRGTQTGPLTTPVGGAIPATGKKVELSCCEVFRMRDGKIVSGRLYYDSLSLLQQLGVAPQPGAGQPMAATEPAQPQP